MISKKIYDHCTVPGCTRPVRSTYADLCNMHYSRRYRHGSVNALLRKKRPHRGICKFPGCTKVDDGLSGYCKLHMTRIRRHGAPDIVLSPTVYRGPEHSSWTGDSCSYTAVHQRLRHVRGSASKYQCVDCGRQAKQWSYNHDATNELVSESGLPYSSDLAHYSPRCVACHKKFDLRYLGVITK